MYIYLLHTSRLKALLNTFSSCTFLLCTFLKTLLFYSLDIVFLFITHLALEGIVEHILVMYVLVYVFEDTTLVVVYVYLFTRSMQGGFRVAMHLWHRVGRAVAAHGGRHCHVHVFPLRVDD